MKTNEELVEAYIVCYSEEHTRDLKKYWERKQTPSDDIRELIESTPDRAAKIIDMISKASVDNWYTLNHLACGLEWDFKHFTGEEYTERLKKLK